jgi:hypothetical protein
LLLFLFLISARTVSRHAVVNFVTGLKKSVGKIRQLRNK